MATLPQALRQEAGLAIAALAPTWPVVSPNAVAHPPGTPIETDHFLLGIDAKTGAITRLRNKATGREWASANNPIALFTYQTLSQEDYQRFLAAYVITKADWAQKDFGKPNIEQLRSAQPGVAAGLGPGARGRDGHRPPDS